VKIAGEPDYSAGITSPLLPDVETVDSSVADENTASSSLYRLQSPTVSQSSPTAKTSGLSLRQKRQAARKSTTATKTKNLSGPVKSSPKNLSTATSTGSTLDNQRQGQRSSATPADEVRTACQSKSFDVVDSDSMAESPRDLLSWTTDDVDSHVSGAKRKACSSVEPKQLGGTSTSRTDDLHDDDDNDDETVMIAGMVGRLRKRLDVTDRQLASQPENQIANNVSPSCDVVGDRPTVAVAADNSHVAMDPDGILVESFPLRQRKSRRKIKPRSRSVTPDRDQTFTTDSAAALEAYNNAVIGKLRSAQRDRMWKQDSEKLLPKYSDGIRDNRVTVPPSTPDRDMTWTEDSATMMVENSHEVCGGETGPLGRKVAVVDLRRFQPGASCPSSDSRKLEKPVSAVKPDDLQRYYPGLTSLEVDETEDTARSVHHCKTSNIAAGKNKPYPHSAPVRRPTPSPSLSIPVSASWNPESRGPNTSPILSDTNSEGDDDFRLVEALTVEQDAESVAHKMLVRWMEIVDGYTALLWRCHSFTSDATIARRLTELRRKTDTLTDALKQFVDVVDPGTMRRVEAMRRRSERRQEVTAGSEPGRREWMVHRAESELSVVGQVAAALKQYYSDISSWNAHNSRSCDIGTMYPTTGIR